MYNAQHVRETRFAEKTWPPILFFHIVFLPSSCKTFGLHTRISHRIFHAILARGKKIMFEARGARFFLAVEHAEYCLEPDSPGLATHVTRWNKLFFIGATRNCNRGV